MAGVGRRRTSRNGGQGDLQVGGEDGHGRSPKGLESLERRFEAGEDAVGGLDQVGVVGRHDDVPSPSLGVPWQR